MVIFKVHVERRLGDIRLRDFRTVHGQRLLREVTGVAHTSILRIKSFLSGVFKHGKREGFLDGENPMSDTSAPGRPVKFKGEVYTMSEIEKIFEALDKADPRALPAVAVAAFAGLRLSEITGLKWSDYVDDRLHVRRSVWRTVVDTPKTLGSESSVPVLPFLASILDYYRTRIKATNDSYMFAGEKRGTPLNLPNLVRRVINPALADWSEKYQEGLTWKGWHAFRRSLASNLYAVGVQPKIIQAILRHTDIGTTLDFYVQTNDNESKDALRKIEDWFQKV